MKKEYRKPCFAVESFQLDAAIAAGTCGNRNPETTLNLKIDTCVLGDKEGEVPTYLFGKACAVQSGMGEPGVDITETDQCYQAMTYAEFYLTS